MGHRKRLKRIEIPGQARYLTFSCYQRLPLFANDAIREAFARQIAVVRSKGAFRLFAWVIMPEHVHLLLVPSLPEWPVAEVLRAIKRPFGQRVIRRWKELNAPILNRIRDQSNKTRFWQRGGGYDRNILESEVFEKIEYTHANPVRRGLVQRTVDWTWSSARWYEGDRDALVPIDPIVSLL